jgi:hypothetical protein
MSKPIAPAVFALRAWTIKKSGNKFYIIPSGAFGMRWSKSYKSLQAACAAIARKHAEEWTQRNERRQAHYGLTKEDA